MTDGYKVNETKLIPNKPKNGHSAQPSMAAKRSLKWNSWAGNLPIGQHNKDRKND